MSSERNKWIEAVGKLITLTQERKLPWRSYSSEGYLSLSGRVDVVYQADYNGKTLRLYESKSRSEGMFPGHGEWETEAVLELVDSNGLSVWTFPHTDATEHLVAAVKYQVAGVGEFLEELLTV
ncbi:MAG TPA: hypothetical protein VEW46_14395 [Pyrinomonadaceae bacterium]|nr:hypothetical protein [Pyrinomonadaceae bacterium]